MQRCKFSNRQLEEWKSANRIKVKITVSYSPEMNNISESNNSLIASKAQYSFSDIHQPSTKAFWPDAFLTSIYLLNRPTPDFLNFEYPLQFWMIKCYLLDVLCNLD